MLLFRSLALGLIAACFFLQVDRGRVPDRTVDQRCVVEPIAPPADVQQGTTIIDVAAAVDAHELPFLLHLRDDERVLQVDDRRIDNNLEAGMAIVEHRNRFVDLTVQSAEGSRRILMLLH